MFGGFLIQALRKPQGSSSTEEEAQLFATEQLCYWGSESSWKVPGKLLQQTFLSKQAPEQPCPCHHTSPKPHQQGGPGGSMLVGCCMAGLAGAVLERAWLLLQP